MNKKLIAALAIVGTFAAPCAALAQGSSVTIYGTFNVDFENVEADDSDVGLEFDQRNRVSQNSSNIGFRGTEDLGNGLKAIFQCESGVAVDTGSSSASTGSFCTRNSNVGLNGPWGTVFYGNWDTPYKFVSLKQDSWYATGIGSHIGIMGTPGFGVATATQAAPGAFGAGLGTGTAANASFDRRQGDSVQYWSPSWNGLAFRVQYSANEGKTADGIAIETDPFTWGAGITYENGPLYLNAAFERHEDYFGLNSMFGNSVAAVSATNDASEDTAYKVGAGYTFGNTTLNVIYEILEYEADGGAIDDFDRDAVFVGLLHKIGAWTVRAAYAHAFEADFDAAGIFDDDDTDADLYVLGASYSFSKRTDVYGLVVFIDNGDNAAYNFGVNQLAPFVLNAAGANTGAGLGSEFRGVGLGIRHAF
jgi:predicted porin